jgi:hypothetical protein
MITQSRSIPHFRRKPRPARAARGRWRMARGCGGRPDRESDRAGLARKILATQKAVLLGNARSHGSPRVCGAGAQPGRWPSCSLSVLALRWSDAGPAAREIELSSSPVRCIACASTSWTPGARACGRCVHYRLELMAGRLAGMTIVPPSTAASARARSKMINTCNDIYCVNFLTFC